MGKHKFPFSLLAFGAFAMGALFFGLLAVTEDYLISALLAWLLSPIPVLAVGRLRARSARQARRAGEPRRA
ncbi:MAG: hypothetical protein AAGG06_06355 [Pseudomonadota bacterium]